MKKIALALLLIVQSCHPVHADNWGLVNYLKAVTPNLIDFIEDNTLYEYGGWEYPEIVIQNQKAICNIVYVPPTKLVKWNRVISLLLPQTDLFNSYNPIIQDGVSKK